jgi:hypothetical protein
MPLVPEFLSVSPKEALAVEEGPCDDVPRDGDGGKNPFADGPAPLHSCRSVRFGLGGADDEDERLTIGGEERRRRTDAACLGLLLASLAALGLVALYGARYGDLRRLYYGYDFLGELCGMGNMTDKPVLFWCRDPSDPLGTQLDLARPMCRESCPSSGDSSFPCFVGSHKGPREVIDESHSFKVEITYNFQEVQDYTSYAFMGRYCLPRERPLAKQVMGWFRASYGTRMLLRADSLFNSWPLLLAVVSLAVAVGFLNLLLLFRFAGCVVVASMAILCSTPLLFGAIVLYDSGFDSAFDRVLTTGDPSWDVALGAGSMLTGVLFVAICCCFRLHTYGNHCGASNLRLLDGLALRVHATGHHGSCADGGDVRHAVRLPEAHFLWEGRPDEVGGVCDI